MNTSRITLFTGSLFGLLAVALGALGAHAWKASLAEAGRLDTFELAVRFQFFHALLLLMIGSWQRKTEINPWLSRAVIAIMAGVLLFSGSLFTLCALGNLRWWWMTPLGGVALMIGWACLAIHALTHRPTA